MCFQQRPENIWIPLCFRECSFLSKTVKAEEVGAQAIIVANQDPESDEFYIEMINDNTSREVHIPAGFLLGKNGYVCWHQTFSNCVRSFQGSQNYECHLFKSEIWFWPLYIVLSVNDLQQKQMLSTECLSLYIYRLCFFLSEISWVRSLFWCH